MTSEDLKKILDSSDKWWPDKARAVYNFHLEMIDLYTHRDNRAEGGWSLRETAKAIGVSRSTIFFYLQAAVLMNGRTDLYKYKSASHFIKEIKYAKLR